MGDLPTTARPQQPGLSALILAGGEGRRAGGEDKGLLPWRGRRLIEHVIERVQPQVDTLYISCNRNRDVYAALAPITSADSRTGYQGPLAGLEAASSLLRHEMVLVVPCDMPLLPLDLATRLAPPLRDNPRLQVSYAKSPSGHQYLCALIRTSSLHSIVTFLDSGRRAVREWYQEVGAIPVCIEENEGQFLNVNDIAPAANT